MINLLASILERRDIRNDGGEKKLWEEKCRGSRENGKERRKGEMRNVN